MIDVNNIVKSFGSVRALRGVTFKAYDGHVTGLLGANGAGKTTTLRILGTVMHPDSGSASVDGHDTVESPMEVQRLIGALPEAKGLYPRLTVRENIRYFGRLHGLERSELENRIDDIVKLLDIREIAERKTEGFSTGQRLKAVIARTLVHDPKNIMLDEPTNGLDILNIRAMRQLIRRLADQGKCVLLSSHIMQDIAAVCDRLVIISKGVVAMTGTPDQIRAETGESDLEEAFVSCIQNGGNNHE